MHKATPVGVKGHGIDPLKCIVYVHRWQPNRKRARVARGQSNHEPIVAVRNDAPIGMRRW